MILLRKKAINEVINWLEDVIKFENDFDDESNGKKDIYNLFISLNMIV